jgi:hypothetical protein
MLGTLLFIAADDPEHLPAGSLEVDEEGSRMNDALCPGLLGFGFHAVAVGEGQLEPGSSVEILAGSTRQGAQLVRDEPAGRARASALARTVSGSRGSSGRSPASGARRIPGMGIET